MSDWEQDAAEADDALPASEPPAESSPDLRRFMPPSASASSSTVVDASFTSSSSLEVPPVDDMPIDLPLDDFSYRQPAAPRMTRARERQMRRQQRGQAVESGTGGLPPRATPASGRFESRTLPPRPSLRQTAPPREFRLPAIPFLREIALGAAGLAFMVGLIALVGAFRGRPAEAAPNALWLGQDWTYQQQNEETMRVLARELRDHRVGAVYAWVGWLQENNTWAGSDSGTNSFLQVENEVLTFAELFNTASPSSDLYAWIQVPASLGEQGYRLGNAELQESIASFGLELITRFGFDGVFVDVDVVANGDESYLALLRRLRATLPETALVAVALPPDWTPVDSPIPQPDLIAPGTVFEEAYKQRVALLADQVVIRAFNSYLETPEDYTTWMAYQVETYARAVDVLATGTEVLIGIPTYSDEPPAHQQRVENIQTAVDGVRAGLQQAGDARRAVRGVAIYADWETDDDEWLQYRQAWLDEAR
ncbi:MAG: hypothetical protein SF029_23300 [bacterium]|nr:hypothetical protein [bacterium]